jgi:chromate transporter
MDKKPRVSLREIFTTFLIIGTTGFGGGMAVVSLTERYCVRQKKWLSIDQFLHGLAFGQILGPFSLNICTFIGYYLRGVAGGVAAATAFILPSFSLISVLAWLYFRFHQLPQLESALKGTNPVVIAVILVAVVSMWKNSVKCTSGLIVVLMAFVGAAFLKISALTILVLMTFWSLAKAYYLRERV